ncbi:MAG: single-stranded DNA-binding protein [Candidatus Gastranaerophilales bacterium]|nr:single-stranded DNA-binding protein [Candidatus Gastranaerophilales bacterium]
MTLARIVVTGKVVKNPEKRFTQSNLAVTSLIVDINQQDETLVRVSAVGNVADKAAEVVSMGDTVIVDGRLQMETVKTSSGKDRKVASINASNIEKISSGSDSSAPKSQTAPSKEQVVQFSTEEIAEDLIDPDEIPF